MKTWTVTAEADMPVRNYTDDTFTGVSYKTESIVRTILTPFQEVAVGWVTATFKNSKNFKVLGCEPGPEIDVIIPIDHGLGGTQR